MGLLDPTDPQGAMLTNIALGLLSAGGPSSRPVSLGEAMGAAGQQGMQAYRDAMQNQMLGFQLQQAKLIQNLRNQALGMPSADAPGQMAQSGGQQPTAPQSAGNPPSAFGPQIAPNAVPYLMSGDPGLIEMGKLMQQGWEPKVTADGKAVMVRNGMLMPVPGAVDAYKKFTEVGEQAKAAYGNPVGMKTPSGAEVQVFPSEFPTIQRGRLPGRLMPTPALNDALNSGQNQASGDFNTPSGRLAGRFDLSGLGVGPSPGQIAEDTAYGKSMGDVAAATVSNASAAAAQLPQLYQAQNLLKDFTPGAFAPYKQKIGEVMIGLGADPQDVNNRFGNVGSMAALNSEIIQMAGKLTRQTDANPSQVQFLANLKAQPGITQTPDGARKILQFFIDSKQYDIDKLMAQNEARRNGMSQDQFESKWPTIAAKKPYVWNTQTGPASAPTYTPLPANPTANKLQKGVVYDTARGPAKWNGMQFESVGP